MLILAHLFQLAAVLLSLAAFAGLGWLLYQFHATGRDLDDDRQGDSE